METILGLNLSTADLKGAYMLSGPIQREVYVRPPRDCNRKLGVVWKLLKRPYGMDGSGSQWHLRADDLILGKSGMERIDSINQDFTRRDGNMIKLLVAKVVKFKQIYR